MSLSAGSRLGPYEILSAIGAGGMGEVYRATDTSLGRQVAIKVLPDAFAQDGERVARFEREAKTLAALNHPYIAQIYGLEKSNGVQALVMELVEGEDLSQRIVRGPIPIDEALPIARQIAEALEAAHEQGIIHRDLKPANIKITPSGVVKVLDFGLAKLAEAPRGTAGDPHALTMSPTITSPAMMTGVGVLLGTAAYMAPEQAKGRPADRRSDIWAFGCVLYEMLTARRAFEGDDISDTLANVLKADPDWTALSDSTSPALTRLLRRSLEKDRKRRLDSAGVARLEIEEAITAPRQADAEDKSSKHFGWRGITALVAGALFLLMIGGLVAWNVKPAARAPGPTRVLLGVAPADELAPTAANQRRPTRTAMALSPDGESIVFSATKGGQKQLYVRAMNRLEATPIPGTENADSPFFSPDGQWVGFWQGELRVGTSGVLKKVPLAGGPAETICRTPYLYGASWGTRNTIAFANGTAGLWQVSADGGAPKSLTSLDTKKGEYSHRLPQMLPGGDAVLFTIERTQYLWDDAQVVVRSLATGEQKVLIDGGADARYVPTGHLVYARMGTLMAVPFDPVRLEVTGRPRGIVENVMQSVNTTGGIYDTGAAQFSVSASGSLVYLPGGAFPEADRILVSVDRNGAAEPLPVSTRNVSVPRLSPDGDRLAYNTVTRGDEAVWIYDIRRGTTSRLTTEGQNSYAIWTPDGKRVTFRSRTAGRSNLFWKAADGTGTNQRLTTSDRDQTPTSWSPDGKVLAFMQRPLVGVAGTNWDIWTLSFQDGGAKERPFLETPAFEQYAEFSPDGRWLAYSSNESGRDEVYVQPYPGPGGRQQVSTEGGAAPAWARNGHEMFYLVAQPSGAIRMTAVDVTLGATFGAGKPRMLFEGLYSNTLTGRSYDVTPDGRRFFMVQPKQQSPEPPFTNVVLVQNWFEELKRLVPAK